MHILGNRGNLGNISGLCDHEAAANSLFYSLHGQGDTRALSSHGKKGTHEVGSVLETSASWATGVVLICNCRQKADDNLEVTESLAYAQQMVQGVAGGILVDHSTSVVVLVVHGEAEATCTGGFCERDQTLAAFQDSAKNVVVHQEDIHDSDQIDVVKTIQENQDVNEEKWVTMEDGAEDWAPSELKTWAKMASLLPETSAS